MVRRALGGLGLLLLVLLFVKLNPSIDNEEASGIRQAPTTFVGEPAKQLSPAEFAKDIRERMGKSGYPGMPRPKPASKAETPKT